MKIWLMLGLCLLAACGKKGDPVRPDPPSANREMPNERKPAESQ
ncbi:MAG: hypothetical protein AAGI34_03050 [Pseudomonadota bacterium]